MNIESDIVNRVGIILNFLAGFMLAPEIIGLKRLAKLEKILEETSYKITTNSINSENKIKGFWMSNFGDYSAFINNLTSVFIATLIYVSLAFIIMLFIKNKEKLAFLGIFLKIIGFIYLIGLLWYSANLASEETPFNVFKWLVRTIFYALLRITKLAIGIVIVMIGASLTIPWIAFLFVLTFILTPIFWIILILLILVLKFIQVPLKFVIKQLSGDERLRIIMVSAGIVIYIIGNFLQFIATF